MKKLILTAALVGTLTSTVSASGPREIDITDTATPIPTEERDDTFPETVVSETVDTDTATPQVYQEPTELPQSGANALALPLVSLALFLAYKSTRTYRRRKAEMLADPNWVGNKEGR